MTYVTERQRRIEQLLREEFEAEGLRVANEDGHWIGYVPADQNTNGKTSFGLDLTKAAQQIEAGLI